MYRINIEQQRLEQKGRHLCIDMDISILCRHIADNQSIVLIPRLTDPGHSHELPVVVISGRHRHRCFRRMLRYFKPYRIYEAIQAVDHSTLWCSYHLDIPYQDWMGQARLSLVDG